MLRQRGRPRHIEARQRAVSLYGQHEAVTQQDHAGYAVRQVQGRAHEGQVHPALVQQAGQGIHCLFARTDVDAGVAGAKAGKLVLQHAGIRGRGHVADFQPSQFTPSRPPRHVLGLCKLRQRARRFHHEQLSGGRQGHGALAALEQTRAQQLFRFLYLLGQGGRRNAEFRSRPREMQAVRHGQHAAEMPQFHVFDYIHHG